VLLFRSRRRDFVRGFVPFVLLTAVACSTATASPAAEEEVALVQNGVDTTAVHNDGQVLTTSLLTASAELQLSALGEAPALLYLPRGCLTVTEDPATSALTYAFADCSGPYGLMHVTGSVKATYSVTADGHLVIDESATGLKANGAVFDWTAHVDIMKGAGAKRVMTYQGTLHGTTARGRSFDATSDDQVDWSVGGDCLVTTGTETATVADRAIKNEIQALWRCGRHCPGANSEAKFTDVASNVTIDVKFDGSSNASVSGPNFSATVPLDCSGN
jgi:hypothetical protein